jgi:hypothetical protein
MTAVHPLPVPGGDLDVRPLDLDSFSAEERAEIEQDLADLAAGRLEGVAHEEIVEAIRAKRVSDG